MEFCMLTSLYDQCFGFYSGPFFIGGDFSYAKKFVLAI